MQGISAIIEILSEDDRREFIQFLQKKNRRGDTKNIRLFRYIERGEIKDLDVLLYGKPARNAYHALCKRLQDSLIDFVASQGFAGETSEELEILKLLLASRIFFEHRKMKIAFKTLKRAERLARSMDVYSILNEIYHTKIQYAHLNPEWNLEDVITSSLENRQRFEQEQQLNMAYASIKAQLRNKTDLPIDQIITEAFAHFEIALDKTLTYKSLFQLMNITTTAARLQSDYHQITPMVMRIYQILSEKEDIADKHRFYHIEILNLMAHTYFRNKDFATSKKLISKMEYEMRKQRNAYFIRFSEKLTLIKALNANYTNNAAFAIELLSNYTGESLDLKLTLITCLFQQNDFKEAYQLLIAMQHTDAFYEKKAGWIWVLKKNIIEILLLIELDKLELVLSRLQSFRTRFTTRLKDMGEDRVIQFVRLAAYVYEHPESATSDDFRHRVEAAFNWKEAAEEDIFVMSFYAWLKSKMQKANLYETTLELVNM